MDLTKEQQLQMDFESRLSKSQLRRLKRKEEAKIVTPSKFNWDDYGTPISKELSKQLKKLLPKSNSKFHNHYGINKYNDKSENKNKIEFRNRDIKNNRKQTKGRNFNYQQRHLKVEFNEPNAILGSVKKVRFIPIKSFKKQVLTKPIPLPKAA